MTLTRRKRRSSHLNLPLSHPLQWPQHGLHAQSGGINPDLRELDPESFEDDEWFVERLRFGSAKGMPALGGIPEGQTDPILDQETLWAIKTYVEARRVVAIEEGEIEAD